MAEPAQPEPGAALSPTGIKQEHEITGLEGLDFSLPPELASKRPLGDEGEVEETASKRLKGENIPDNDLEDGLALLVQNALSGVGDLVGDFDGSGTGVGDAMDTDPSSLLDNAVPSSTFYSEPLKYVRGVQTYALANLALTLLYSLVQHQPVDDVLNAIRDKDSEHGKTFRRLKQTLESTWTLFTDNEIISADELQIQGESRTLLDLANLAMLSSWLVEGSSESYSKADSNFLSIFNSSISDLPSGAPDLYLAIKTQKTIEALLVKPVEKETATLITECMTDGMEEKVRSQHAGQELTAADQAFLTVVRARQDELQTETKEKIDKAALKKKHPADEVLRCIAAYVKTRLAAVSDLGQKYGVPIELVSDTVEPMSFTDGADGTDMDLDDLSSFFERTASGLVQDALAGLGDGDEVPTIHIDGPENEGASGTNGTEKPATNLMTDYKELEALVAESTSNYVKTTLNGLSPVPYQPTVPTSTTESMAAQLPYLAHLQQHQAQHPYYTYTQPMQEQQQPQQPASGENLPPNQTFPSAILYDKARQAALSKSSTHTRREGLHSTRRPWTQEEEKALMAGLDMVKGPHWSQILTLFGQNGTISDILKDRTQVQLKDKARNLKLFFLKTNSEMPYYLQAVTGELKTRAPTQAARKEAEERARLNSEEDQAKLQGIMALAGGLQHLSQNRSSSTPGVGSSVVTPAQAAQSAQSRPGTAATSIPRTVASTMAQNRTGLSASTQQTLQSIQASRSQSQLPPHVPRPQGQQQMSQAQHSQQSQQGQHQQGQPQQAQPRPQSQQGQQQPQQNMQQQQQQQPQQQPLRQPQQQEPQQHPQHLQAAPHAIPPSSIPPRSASNTPTTVPSPAHGHSVPTSQPQTPVTQHTPVTQRTPQPPQASSTGPLPTETPKEVPKPPESITPEEAQEAENAAEAALLEGLQAAVAEALS